MDVFGGSWRTHEKFADEKGAWRTAFAPPVVLCARVAGSTFGARDFEGQPLGEGPGRSRGWAWESARESSPKLMHLFFAGLYVRVSDCILCFFKMFKEGLKKAEVLILFPDNVF